MKKDKVRRAGHACMHASQSMQASGQQRAASPLRSAGQLHGARWMPLGDAHVLTGVVKGMEESFVVLGPASTLRQQQQSAGPSSASSQQQPGSCEGGGRSGAAVAVGLDAKLQALSKIFDMASLETQVGGSPVPPDCMVGGQRPVCRPSSALTLVCHSAASSCSHSAPALHGSPRPRFIPRPLLD